MASATAHSASHTSPRIQHTLRPAQHTFRYSTIALHVHVQHSDPRRPHGRLHREIVSTAIDIYKTKVSSQPPCCFRTHGEEGWDGWMDGWVRDPEEEEEEGRVSSPCYFSAASWFCFVLL